MAALDRQALDRVARQLEQSGGADQREAARALRMFLALLVLGVDLEALYRKHTAAKMRPVLERLAAHLARRGMRAEAARARFQAASSDDERAALMIESLREGEPAMSLRRAAKCVGLILGRDEGAIRSNYLRRKRGAVSKRRR